jgi:hypothetical protein
LLVPSSLKSFDLFIDFDPKEASKEMANLICSWVDSLNVLDFEGVLVGMIPLVGFDLPKAWSKEASDVSCA